MPTDPDKLTDATATGERTLDTQGRGSRTRDPSNSRRRFLLGVATATALLAGCVGDGDDATDDDTAGTPTDDTATGDDAPDDEDGDDATDDDPTDAPDDEDGDDATDDGPADAPDDEDGDDATDDDPADDPTDAELFFRKIRWDGDYRMTGTVDGEEGRVSFETRVHQGDMYTSLETEELGSVETYRIGTTTYFVQGGQCTVFEQDPERLPDDPFDPDDPDDIEAAEPTITNLGPDTIDGDAVTAYELVYPDGETQILYLLDSGRVRRVEFDQGTVDLFDWGGTSPVEPPDMDCRSPGR